MLKLAIITGALSVLFDALVYLPLLSNKFKNLIALVAAADILIFSGAALAVSINGLTIVLGIINLYRIFNYARLIRARMHKQYLLRTAQRTAILLILFQAVIILLKIGLSTFTKVGLSDMIKVCIIVDFVLAAMLLLVTLRNIRKTEALPFGQTIDYECVPTVSVCIPARNETDDLEACLRSLLSNNYPKLEILVLDDCSQDRHTAEVIRSFAHAGVRFLQGEPAPKEHWLAKNWAYEQLLKEASGEYIVFCGVDVRFEPKSLVSIVSTIMRKKKSMMSIVPEYFDDRGKIRLIQPMRYFWEIAPPRRIFRRPPVLSSCWIINSARMHELGGFSSVTRSIVPEAFFAHSFIANNGYSFVRSSGVLGITSFKVVSEQWDTAVRVRYPQLHRHPEWVMLVTLFETTVLLVPFAYVLFGWLAGVDYIWALAMATVILLWISYGWTIKNTFYKNSLVSALALPAALILDTFLANYSMYRYEFSDIEWKERNVCIPVMHVTPSLPPN